MKKKNILLFVIAGILCLQFSACSQSAMQSNKEGTGETGEISQIFPAENKGDPTYNTGESYLSVLKFSGNNMITSFRFEKGARNYWHSHPDAEQTLMILSGEAYYQEEGKEKQVLHAGDVVVTEANVKHWNGASENSACTCLTVSEKNDKEHAIWYDEVTNEEFSGN